VEFKIVEAKWFTLKKIKKANKLLAFFYVKNFI
jgi:hypothetical protein